MTSSGIGVRLATLALATALAASLAPARRPGPRTRARRGSTATTAGPSPPSIALPNGFQPEGIAIKGRTAYFGSLADGDIYAVNLRTGKGKVISQGPGTPSVGLKIDQRDRLFVAGGPPATHGSSTSAPARS